jgi:sulfur relay (sulfurtransferase) DsrF/TusC family protein
MRFEEATSAVIDALEERTEAELAGAETLEAAAQRFCEILQETFAESTVLARVFATVPYGALPAATRTFVRRLVGARTEQLKPKTPVLSLLGTRGVLPRWNSRHLSEEHVGIPLASAEFVDAIPMIASLLKQLGIAIANAEGVETTIVTQALGKAAGVFFVDDAETAVDSQGRSIITARDFVQEHGVSTVFGFGGAYAITGTFVVTILFTSESVGRGQAERFMRLANRFKAATMRPVGRGQIFA